MSEQHSEPSTEIQAEPSAPVSKPKLGCLPLVLLLIFLLTLLPGPLFFVSIVSPGPMKETKTVIIPLGTSVIEVGRLLDQSDAILHPLLFRAMSRMLAKDKLKAGEYEISPGMSVIDIVHMMRDGKMVVRQFTAPEGLSSYEIVRLLKDVPALTGDVEKVPVEGSLLPETYRYTYGDTRQSILDRMQEDQRALMTSLWEKRDVARTVSTPEEALILASIVEKETGKMPDERPRVASVFLNRLNSRMPLQSDPTVIYALTKGKGPLGRSLSKADLATLSPFNTYKFAGLPPSPISNPGRAAIEAVLRPDKTDYLYFVADGTGGHAFAKTLAEHNKNVVRWIKLCRP